jgi:F-type H+-transporting ATPase subunit a
MSTVEQTTQTKSGMSTTRKAVLGIAFVYLAGLVAFAVIFGIHGHKNEQFKVIDSFHLENWFKIAGPIQFDKGVLYLLLATLITLAIMIYVAWHMHRRPGRLQVAVEAGYELMSRVTRENMSDRLAKKWFPFIFTLFVFILVSNLLGYIPLPVDSENTFKLLGANIPSFQIYAAVTNLAVPLVLTLIVFFSYVFEGVRHHGPIGYLKSLIPRGVSGPILILIAPLEILSNFVLRPLSLTIRLWANLLAGHLLIDFMGGTLAVLLGLQLLGWLTLPLGIILFLFEAVLIAGLQAFIFSILAAIYIGGATSASH